MHGSDRFARQLDAQRKGGYIGSLVLVTLVFILPMGIAVMAVLAELGVVHDTSYPRGAKTFAIAVVCLAICAALAGLAVHFEHRLRGDPTGRLTSELSYLSARPFGRRRAPGYRRYRRYGPTSALVSGIAFILLGGLAVWAAFASNAATSKSSYTQQNGIQDTATVGSVANQYGKSSDWANVSVTLRTPVGGQQGSVVYIPNNASYSAGQVISVLVDPADPVYSELPGSPYTTGSDVAGAVIAAVVCLPAGIFGIVSSVRMRRRRRRQLAAADIPPALGDAGVFGPGPAASGRAPGG